MMDWRARAGCLGTDSALWFPGEKAKKESAAERRRVAQAKEICGRCPVRAECLLYAIDSGQHHGIWGGQTEDELANLRRGRNRRRLAALVS